MEFIQSLFDVDWSALITSAIASGVGLSVITQLLKTKWIAIPATRFPRVVSGVLAVVVGIISTLAAGLDLSSIVNLIVFVVVTFIVSGMSYDSVKGLVGEIEKTNKNETDVAPAGQLPFANLSLAEVANEVIDGKWGSGEFRRKQLKFVGYDPDEVQEKVREILGKK